MVKELGLFLDEGFIRCKGRIDNAELSYSARFPFLLPKKHWFTKLIIEECHQQALHGGVQDTLCKLREHYWVPQGRQSVKSVITKCYVCRRLEGPNCDYPSPPPLPSFRVDSGVPFLTTEVDFTGALNMMDSDTGESHKVYCCNWVIQHLLIKQNKKRNSKKGGFSLEDYAHSCETNLPEKMAAGLRSLYNFLQECALSRLFCTP